MKKAVVLDLIHEDIVMMQHLCTLVHRRLGIPCDNDDYRVGKISIRIQSTLGPKLVLT